MLGHGRAARTAAAPCLGRCLGAESALRAPYMVRDPEGTRKEIGGGREVCQYLEANGVKWRTPQPPVDRAPPPPFAQLSTEEKVRLFRGLFRGRTDVYPVRWESKTTGKSGYAPACLNEWAAGICHKPRIKCADCEHRSLASITDPVIYDHLAGEHTVGIYPLLHDNTCHFLAVDFDEQEWREDALAFVESCRTLGVPAALEISRSGDGAHVWLFFSQKVDARDARRLGTALISHVCARTRQLKLSSYDRLLPNQDTMPKGGFGNLIALPLQKKPRDAGRSVFVDDEFLPYPDQWGFLASVRRMPVEDIEPTILQATGGSHTLDVTFIEDEDHQTPWLTPLRTSKKISGPLPESLHLTLATLSTSRKRCSLRHWPTVSFAWRPSRTRSSTRHKPCASRSGTNRASSGAQRTTPTTSHCRAVAWTTRSPCWPPTASVPLSRTSASRARRSTCASLARCATTRRSRWGRHCSTTPASSAHRPPSARPSRPRR